MIKGKNLVNGKAIDTLNTITFKTFNAKEKTVLPLLTKTLPLKL